MSKMFNGLLVQFDEISESRVKPEERDGAHTAKAKNRYAGRRNLKQKNNKQNKLSAFARMYLVGTFVGKFGFKK